MDGGTLFIIEMILLHGAILVFAIYQFWSVSRLRKRRRNAKSGPEPGASRSHAPGHAEGQHQADPGPRETLER